MSSGLSKARERQAEARVEWTAKRDASVVFADLTYGELKSVLRSIEVMSVPLRSAPYTLDALHSYRAKMAVALTLHSHAFEKENPYPQD